MAHHYGRHGPHAWLRWHQRHSSSSSLPARAKEGISVIRVHIPEITGMNPERIIFIIMGNNNLSGEDYIEEIANITQGNTVNVITDGHTEKDQPLIIAAQWKARDDVNEIIRLRRKGKRIRIDQTKQPERMEEIVDKYLDQKKDSLKEPPPDLIEYRHLVKLCTKAYEKRFQEGIGEENNSFHYFQRLEEIHLQERAKQDRQEGLPNSDQDYHIRDLAVIRALQELNFMVYGATSRLADVHSLADAYLEYYANPDQEEVIWPLQGNTF